MERAIDKFILFGFVAYAFSLYLEGTDILLPLYISVAIAAAELWLIPGWKTNRSEREMKIRKIIVLVLLDAVAATAIFFPWMIGAFPLLVYDLLYSKHWPGLAVSAIAYLNALNRMAAKDVLPVWMFAVVTAGILLALWLCRKTVRILQDENKIKKLRDDDEEQRQTLSLQNSQLIEAKDAEVITAQLAERNRIAREIHDNVGHTLSRALLQVGALLAIHKEEPVHSELAGVRETLDSAMNSIRSSVHDLHDSSIDLAGTVRQMAEPLQESFHVNLEVDASADMPREVKYGLIGILREAISNILRHSRNDTVLISILEHPGFYQMVVHDYLAEEADRKKQPVTGRDSGTPVIGLTNIENRVRAMGGTVSISEESGFRIFVSVPK